MMRQTPIIPKSRAQFLSVKSLYKFVLDEELALVRVTSLPFRGWISLKKLKAFKKYIFKVKLTLKEYKSIMKFKYLTMNLIYH